MSARRKTVIVTGATGFIGSALVRGLIERDMQVVALSRNPPNASVPPGVRWYPYDLGKSVPSEALAGADALIHAAHAKDAGTAQSFTSNVEGSRRLLEAARAHGVGRSIFLSSLSARPEARSSYGRQKLLIETLFTSPDATIARPGLVIGFGGLFGRMFAHLKDGRPVPLLGSGTQPLQTVYVEDLLAALLEIVERDLGGTFVLASPQAISYKHFCQAIAAAQGVRPRLIPVPFWLAEAAIAAARLLRIQLPIDRENLRGLRSMQYVPVECATPLNTQMRDFETSLEALMQQRSQASNEMHSTARQNP